MTALVTGGSGSGKSAWAEDLVCRLSPGRKLYLATMLPEGRESQSRIARHRRLRAGKGFETVECPWSLEDVPVQAEDAVLLECLPNLLANVMFAPGAGGEAADRIWEELEGLAQRCGHMVVVSNEVFSDGVDYAPETAAYLDALGTLNRRLAARAELAVEVVCGIALLLKGELPG